MNRRDFFGSLLGGATALAIAPNFIAGCLGEMATAVHPARIVVPGIIGSPFTVINPIAAKRYSQALFAETRRRPIGIDLIRRAMRA